MARAKPWFFLLIAAVGLGAAGVQVSTQPAATMATTRPADGAVAAENDRLRREVADLKKTVETLKAENERLKKQWNDAVRNGTGAVAPTSAPATTKPVTVAQDGPGLYKVSAGPGLKYTATVRAKSRDDAINIALKTVAKTAMDYDENVNINELRVERLGP